MQNGKTEFRIAAVQIPSVRGNIDGNLAVHVAAARTAATHGVSLLVFPELSLTGYEPDLADTLAMRTADDRLAPLAGLARMHAMEIVAGAPLRDGPGKPKLGAIVIGSDGTVDAYHKVHLGGVEPQHFSPGSTPMIRTVGGRRIGLAVCADSSDPAHPEACARAGATIYAAGVFLTAEWYESDVPRLAAYAAKHEMLTVMANHGASVGTHEAVGNSAIWNPDGSVLVTAHGTGPALLVAISDGDRWRGKVVPLDIEASNGDA